jgi:hypothetical protein
MSIKVNLETKNVKTLRRQIQKYYLSVRSELDGRKAKTYDNVIIYKETKRPKLEAIYNEIYQTLNPVKVLSNKKLLRQLPKLKDELFNSLEQSNKKAQEQTQQKKEGERNYAESALAREKIQEKYGEPIKNYWVNLPESISMNEHTQNKIIKKVEQSFNNKEKSTPSTVLIQFKITFGGNNFRFISLEQFNLTGHNQKEFIQHIHHQIKKLINELNNSPNNEEYENNLKAIRILIIKTPKAGGCDCREHSLLVNNMKLVSVYSNNNNCLFNLTFHAIKKINKTFLKPSISKIRKHINVSSGEPIPVDKLAEVAEQIQCEYILYDDNANIIDTFGASDEYKIPICLRFGHYYYIDNIDYTTKYCTKCCKHYIKDSHICNKTRVKEMEERRKGKDQVKTNCKTKSKPIDLNKMIFYDLETFGEGGTDEQNNHNVYACGMWMNGDYKQQYGQGSMNLLINALEQNYELDKPKKYNICAYNGSGFDYYFLMNELINNGFIIKSDSFIISNGKLVSFHFGKMAKDGNIKYCKVFDLYLFLMSSLKDAGSSFEIDKELQKKDFNHELIKSWADVEKYRNDVEPYLKTDVLCLKEVFDKFSSYIFEKFEVHITDYLTLSHMAYNLWCGTLDESMNIKIPKLDEYKFISSSIYGARCYPMTTGYTSTEYEKFINASSDEERKEMYKYMTDYVFNGDVVSLYPTSMKNEYPVGDSRWLSDEEIKNIDMNNKLQMGIYEIDYITNKKIVVPILPQHTKEGGLDWTLYDGSGTYTSIDVENAVRFGYKVVIKRALVWESVARVFDDYINDAYEIKVKGDKEDKPVLRACGKLLMNSLYGKMLQTAIFKDTKMCNNLTDVYEFLRTNKIDDYQNFGTKMLMTGESLDEFKQGKINKPRQLGAFVLGYSRRLMLNAMEKVDPTLNTHFFNYTDTDSLHMHIDNIKHVEGLLGSNLGDMSNDIKKGGRILKEICLGPKNYTYVYVNELGQMKHTMKCKGIPKKYLFPELYYTHDDSEQVYNYELSEILGNQYFDKPTEPILMKGLKKIRNGNFTIKNHQQTRTFNKTSYSKMTLLNGRYYPKGYIF